MSDQQAAPLSKRGRIIIAAIVAAVFGYTFISVAHGEDDPPHPEISKGEAWSLCKQAVAEQLRHPDSADFKILGTDISETISGYSIVGTLKASNDFGVEDEYGYTCDVRSDGTVDASVS